MAQTDGEGNIYSTVQKTDVEHHCHRGIPYCITTHNYCHTNLHQKRLVLYSLEKMNEVRRDLKRPKMRSAPGDHRG